MQRTISVTTEQEPAKQLMMDTEFCSMLRTLSALPACNSETLDPDREDQKDT